LRQRRKVDEEDNSGWDDETVIRSTLKDIAKKVGALGIERQALILVGSVLDSKRKGYHSRLYNKNFSHGYRQRKL